MDAGKSVLSLDGAIVGGVVVGSGLERLVEVVSGSALTLPVNTRDAFGNFAVLVPAPTVTVTLTSKSSAADTTALTGAVSKLNSGDGTVDITAPGNGVVVTVAGEYTLAVSLAGVGGGAIPVEGSPIAVTVVAGGAHPPSCTAAGAGLTAGVTASAAVERAFAVTLKAGGLTLHATPLIRVFFLLSTPRLR